MKKAAMFIGLGLEILLAGQAFADAVIDSTEIPQTTFAPMVSAIFDNDGHITDGLNSATLLSLFPVSDSPLDSVIKPSSGDSPKIQVAKLSNMMESDMGDVVSAKKQYTVRVAEPSNAVLILVGAIGLILTRRKLAGH